jgi:hypothetical protein
VLGPQGAGSKRTRRNAIFWLFHENDWLGASLVTPPHSHQRDP